MLLPNSAVLAECKPNFPINFSWGRVGEPAIKYFNKYVFLCDLGKTVPNELQKIFPKQCHFPNLGGILTV